MINHQIETTTIDHDGENIDIRYRYFTIFLVLKWFV